jgi:hypothetical protein
MSRAIGIAGVTALLLVGPAVAHAGSSKTLRFDALVKQSTVIDQAPSGVSLGDEQVASGVLQSGSKHVGDFAFTCTAIAVFGDRHVDFCNATATLKGGDLVASGISDSDSQVHTWVMTGGTGKYRRSRGQVLLHDVSETETRVMIRLG